MRVENDDQKLTLKDEAIAWRQVGDEIVILQLESATYLSLNGSGRVLWMRLSEGATTADLADSLTSTYGITEERALGDARAFVASLKEQNLVI